MSAQTIVVSAVDFAAVGIYAFLSWKLSRRLVSPENRLSVLQFSLFWLGLSLVSLIGGIESAVATVGTPPLPFVVTLFYVEILLLSAALWGLVGYLIRLYTGRSHLLPLTGLYATLYVLLVYFITASIPSAVMVTRGTVSLSYTTTVGGPLLGILIAILLAPEIVGAALYFTLYFRTRERTARYRIALVSWGLLAYFGVGLADVGARLGGSAGAVAIGAVIGLVPAFVILLAYYPPRSVRERLGVTGIESVTGPLTRS